MILDPNNRQVKLSVCTSWDDLAESYHKTLSSPLDRTKRSRALIGTVVKIGSEPARLKRRASIRQ
ncbi:hypothetical protein [Nitrosomonas aestuarii]|uniref:hypothetical protein n=1 Tax=Nitrosomonas aestuarii TaxID=52441 RepID=UPI0011B21D68|nr:hypothetical protein [Nitrosomonas aestuarii]